MKQLDLFSQQLEYNGWQLFDSMPEGWKIDKTCGSPLAGYVFISDGVSPLRGGKHALLNMSKREHAECDYNVKNFEYSKKEAPAQVIDKEYFASLNTLAREQSKERLLKDIQTDLVVCEIEGWNKREYIKKLKNLLDSIDNQFDK